MQFKKPKKVDRLTDQYMKTYNIVRKGDIAFEGHKSKDYSFGRFVENDLEDGIVSHIFDVFRPISEHDLLYWKYFIHNELKMGPILRRVTTKSTMMMNLVSKDFLKAKVPIPAEFKEQQQIGEILRQVDITLTLHEEKLEQLKALKRGMLQKLFPSEGDVVPVLRHEGFYGEWSHKKLSDIATITMGQSPKGSTYSDTPSDYILVQGNADMENGWVKPRVWTTQVTKQAEKGDLILSVRAPAGEIGKTAYDVVLGRGVAAIKGNEFLFQTLYRMNQMGYWKKYLTGSTFEALNSDNLKNATIKVPNKEEQKEIASLLKQLDLIISSYRNKLAKLQSLKKFLLQNLFI